MSVVSREAWRCDVCEHEWGNKILAESSDSSDDEDSTPSWWGDGDLLMAFDLGYDESGSDDTLLVTMQLAITEQARKLRRRWRRELENANVRYFHAKEFANFEKGVFAGLSRDQRAKLLNRLAKITEDHVYIGMTAKVTKSIFEAKTTPKFREKWGTAYTFAIQMLVVGAYMFAEHMGYKPEFNVLIEDGHKSAGGAVDSLNAAKKAGMGFEIPSRIITVGLGSKLDHPILQSADMLAYSEWQRMRGRDLTIYNAMHSSHLKFEPEFLDFDDEMVDVVVNGAEQWMAHRKAACDVSCDVLRTFPLTCV